MAAAAVLSFSLSLLLLFHVSLAQFGIGQGSQRRFGSKPGQCQLKRLNALDPTRRVRSEAGITEYFDIDSSEELQCAGVTAYRRTLEPRGLALPCYLNAPRLVYVLRGSATMGAVIPGCPETFQSFQETGSERFREQGHEQTGQSFRDEHQRIQHIKEGDVIALPAGVATWSYNDGDKPLVTITVVDISNNANQLDRNHREFLLAGKQKGSSGHESFKEGQETSGNNNILSGFDLDLLSQATGLNREVVRHIQGKDDERGEMIRVERGLEVLRPSRKEREQREHREQEEEWGRKRMSNGVDETYCSMRIMENIADPSCADVYTPRGGRITILNSHKLPMLGLVQLSAERVVLYSNALLMPHWNINAHSLVYVTGGRGKVQIVGNQGQLVFDGEIREGQILFVPQNYAVIKKAHNEGLEWIAVKTNSNAMVSQVTGKMSVLRGIPENVLMNAYRISDRDVKQLKFKWDKVGIIAPGSSRSERGYSDA